MYVLCVFPYMDNRGTKMQRDASGYVSERQCNIFVPMSWPSAEVSGKMRPWTDTAWWVCKNSSIGSWSIFARSLPTKTVWIVKRFFTIFPTNKPNMKSELRIDHVWKDTTQAFWMAAQAAGRSGPLCLSTVKTVFVMSSLFASSSPLDWQRSTRLWSPDVLATCSALTVAWVSKSCVLCATGHGRYQPVLGANILALHMPIYIYIYVIYISNIYICNIYICNIYIVYDTLYIYVVYDMLYIYILLYYMY